MDLKETESERVFRLELRTWLANNHPGAEPEDHLERIEWLLKWQASLNSGGWAAVDWPEAYGGRGASTTESAIYFEELGRAKVPLPPSHTGMLLVGPTLLVHGTEEQRRRYMPPILTGEEMWCQGFSEPGAGSDLAGLRMRAVDDGEGWVLNGQKTWTSQAHYADLCVLLARTSEPKHGGLTMFILDMKQPGVNHHPIVQMNGEHEFNDVFLDDARIPYENVIGEVDDGWNVAITMLMSERAAPGFFDSVRLRQLFDRLVGDIAADQRFQTPLVLDRLGKLYADIETLRATAMRGLANLSNHGRPGPEASVSKLMWQEAYQGLTELAADVLGPVALTAGTTWSHQLLSARSATIEGGSREILKNIVAERVLGLPRLNKTKGA